jgi:hypothetical protein
MPVSADSDRRSRVLAVGLLIFLFVLYIAIPRNASLWDFDPDRLASRETKLWRDYYDQRYPKLFFDLYLSSRRDFGFSPLDSFRMALAAAHAARLFQTTQSRDEANAALPALEVYYRLLEKGVSTAFDYDKAAQLELDWWQARRDKAPPQDYGRTIAATTALVYGVDNPLITEAGVMRAQAMAYRDERGRAMTAADWNMVQQRLAAAYGKLKQGLEQR